MSLANLIVWPWLIHPADSPTMPAPAKPSDSACQSLCVMLHSLQSCGMMPQPSVAWRSFFWLFRTRPSRICLATHNINIVSAPQPPCLQDCTPSGLTSFADSYYRRTWHLKQGSWILLKPQSDVVLTAVRIPPILRSIFLKCCYKRKGG